MAGIVCLRIIRRLALVFRFKLCCITGIMILYFMQTLEGIDEAEVYSYPLSFGKINVSLYLGSDQLRMANFVYWRKRLLAPRQSLQV